MLTTNASAGRIKEVLEHFYPVKKVHIRHIISKSVLPADCMMNCDKCKNMRCANKGGAGWIEKEIHERVVDEEDLKSGEKYKAGLMKLNSITKAPPELLDEKKEEVTEADLQCLFNDYDLKEFEFLS